MALLTFLSEASHLAYLPIVRTVKGERWVAYACHVKAEVVITSTTTSAATTAEAAAKIITARIPQGRVHQNGRVGESTTFLTQNE